MSEPNSHFYIKKGEWLLILSYRKYNCYQIIGKTKLYNKSNISLRKAHIPVLLFHNENGSIGLGNRLIMCNDIGNILKIPDYKMDVELF